MLVAYFDTKGKALDSKKDLKKEVFGVKVNKKLLAQAVAVYLGNQRQANAHTKDRSEVSGGGKKPWKQKGTGRARAGSSRSPIWKGGGVTFGPKNTRNYKKSLTKKMRKAAMLSSFSMQAANEGIVVYQGMELKNSKTQDLIKILGKNNEKGLLIVQAGANDSLFNAAHNLEGVKLEVVNAISYYDVLKAKKIILLEDALDKIYEFWGKEKQVKAVKEEVVKEEVKKKEVKKEEVKKVVTKAVKKPVVKKKIAKK